MSGSIVEADATLNFKLLSSESALNAAVPPARGNVEQQVLTARGAGLGGFPRGRPTAPGPPLRRQGRRLADLVCGPGLGPL